jgi:hypothetical protein
VSLGKLQANIGSFTYQQNLRESHLPQIADIYQHGLLSNYQFGFSKMSSPAAAATEIVDEIIGAIDGKKIAAGMFLAQTKLIM